MKSARLFRSYLFISLFALSLSCEAQTNSTNSPALLRALAKNDSIIALNKIFSVNYDSFDKTTMVRLKRELKIMEGLTMDVFCFVSQSRPIPTQIRIHFTNKADDWEFLKFSPFKIKWENHEKDFGTLKVKSDVMEDGVLEQMTADFSLDEFTQISNSNFVEARLGLVTFNMRQNVLSDWKVLVQYFNVLKFAQSEKQDNPSK